METNLGYRKVKCVVCGKELATRESGTTLTEIGPMCVACAIAYKEEKARLELQARSAIRKGLNVWLKKQQAVKQFYNRQYLIPGTGEGRGE